jgi:hypothetical protein
LGDLFQNQTFKTASKQIDAEVLKQFKVVYKEGKLRKVEIYLL